MIAGRQQHPVDAQTAQELDQLIDLIRAGLAENGRIGLHAIAPLLEQLDHLDAGVEMPRAINNAVVGFAHAVDMHVEAQVRAGRDLLDKALDQDRVGADHHVAFLLFDQAGWSAARYACTSAVRRRRSRRSARRPRPPRPALLRAASDRESCLCTRRCVRIRCRPGCRHAAARASARAESTSPRALLAPHVAAQVDHLS